MGTIDATFPVRSLIPLVETGVSSFLQKYPDYNGKDVTIAIFDSGVDSQATGLETLCDGKTVKVLERYDCSGCGDVDCTKKVTADENGCIEGLSGRKLKLTKDMLANNIDKAEFRIGLKHLYDLMPKKVSELAISKEKAKVFDEPNKKALAEVSRKITEFEAVNSDTSKLTWDKKLAKDNLDNLLELLNNYDKSFTDVKTSYDCVLYRTETGWQVVIDNTEKGDLANALHLGEYSKTHEIKNVGDYHYLSANVHDDGDVLEIVGMCSSHGTHVASIASANHGNKELDGVAPNANIVSFTIGDGRIGSMETGAALVRAMSRVMDMCKSGRKIDVINMSYGEHACWSNTGRIGELMSEVVNKYGVVWVASAGNHGPALSTVGTPPDISQPSLIGVGAYVSPQMMEAEYAMREKLPGNVYTWTSRDPCIDGGQGVTICAPGGAIASVPQYTMSKSMLMNGTSMAAPHVAGAVALLISGLKQKGIEYSPFSIKRALSATATKLDYVDRFAQGSGLLNVDKAFEHLVEYAKEKEVMLRFSVRVGPQSAKGIYVRAGPLRKSIEYNVDIEPIFFNDVDAARENKFNYNVRLNLIPSQPFVQCGAFLDLSYHSRSIAVKVDPTGLPPGVHTANIRAYDTDCVQKGALFEIPVTIIQPNIINTENSRMFEPISQRSDGTIEFQPNTIQREFIFVPNGATWAVLRMRSHDKNREFDTGKFFIHIMQLLPKESCRKLEVMKILNVNSETDTTLTFRVQANNIVELCIAKYWSNYGNTHLKYNVEFHGVTLVNPCAYVMQAALGVHKLEIAALGSEEIQPSIQLKNAAVVLKPTESKISPLSATRDMLPEGRQIYQNVLNYTLNLSKPQEVAVYAPLFNLYLYESAFESQFFMIFDANKRVVSFGDAHSHNFFSKLDKGEYTIKLQVRHDKRDLLEKVNEAQLVVLFKLANALNLDLYDQYSQAIINKSKFVSAFVKEYTPRVLYVGALSQERIAKANLPAQTSWLTGTISLSKDDVVRRIDVHKFDYVLHADSGKKATNGNSINNNATAGNNSAVGSPKASKAKTTVAAVTTVPSAAAGDGISAAESDVSVPSSPQNQKASVDEYAEGLRDFQCSMIKKLELEKAEKVYDEVVAAHPKHLQAHLLLIQNLESADTNNVQYPFTFQKAANAVTVDNEKNDKQIDNLAKQCATLKRIIKLADIVITETDKDALLAYYGLKSDTRPDAAKIKTNMDKQKNTLIEALSKKGISVGKLAILENNFKDHLDEFDNIYSEIVKFVDATDPKVIQFSLWHAYSHGQFGRMYKYLHKHFDEKRTRDVVEELAATVDAQGYTHIKNQILRAGITLYPPSYRIF